VHYEALRMAERVDLTGLLTFNNVGRSPVTVPNGPEPVVFPWFFGGFNR
jgi:hypothetical protein